MASKQILCRYPRPANFSPDSKSMIVGLLCAHVFALSAFAFFTWEGLVAFVFLGVLTGYLGITLCFHRLMAHQSFQTFTWLRRLLAIFASLAWQSGPISWVATHRYHHKVSDQTLDPHSPRMGFFWAHIVWTVCQHPKIDKRDVQHRYARDVAQDPFFRFLEHYLIHINVALGMALFLLGMSFADWRVGLSVLLWGFFLRLVYIWHVTFLVNSVTHIIGSRRFDTPDNSKNVWWVALLTFGEGWHNNHHADPRSAAHGLKWFEWDPTFWSIVIMERLGLAWNVVRPLRPRRKRKPAYVANLGKLSNNPKANIQVLATDRPHP